MCYLTLLEYLTRARPSVFTLDSGRENHSQDLQAGFINTTVTTADGHISLQSQLHEYEQLQHPIRDGLRDPGDVFPHRQPPDYLNIIDDPNSLPAPSTSRKAVSIEMGDDVTHSLRQPQVYEEITTGTIGIQDESGDSGPRSQHEGYVEVEEYYLPGPMTEEHSRNSRENSQACGYIHITEYPDTLPSPSKRNDNQTVSMET